MLCLWPNTENTDTFLRLLNEQVPSIRFTMEKENEGKLPFLDCLVHRVDRTFKFTVYRKPTNISSYVHFYSAHNEKVKKSIFSSMFLRAFRVCSPEFIDNEINNIKCTGKKLKYPERIIECALKSAKKSFYRIQEREPYNNKNLLVLPYTENMKDAAHLLKTLNINTAFKNDSTVKTKLIKNSPSCAKGCVYEIPCKSCSKVYIGQTGKDLSERLKQHKQSIRYGQESNAIFAHVRDYDHNIDWDNAKKIVSNCSNIQIRNIIESSIIKENSHSTLNISQGLYRIDKCISSRINKLYYMPIRPP